MWKVIAILCLVVGARASSACVVAPSGSYDSIPSLVNDARGIVLATAVEKRNDESEFYATVTFEIRERLRGRSRGDTFELQGIVVPPDMKGRGDFDRHRDPRFWADPHENNGTLRPDCQIFGIFEIGETYLVFLGGKPHFKAFEKIESEDDFWLEVVRTALKR